MRANGIRARTKRKFRVTTDSRHDYPVAPNLLDRQFTVEAPNTVWLADLSYIWTREGWLYLAVVLDLFSRQVVGWAMDEQMPQELTLAALDMALKRRRPLPGLMHHSDRGSQYAAGAYRKQLAGHGIVCSMSRKGNCWDNAPMESFFHTLKTELVHHRDYQTRDEARRDIFEFIEIFYNRQRSHSTWRNRSGAAGAANALSPRKGSGFEGGGSPRCHSLVRPGAGTATAFEESRHGSVCRVGRFAGSDDGACPG
jgi:transposase InsO family protein